MPRDDDEVSWQCPPFEEKDENKLAFLKRCVSQGIAWVQDNCKTEDMERAMTILSGKPAPGKTDKWAEFTTGDLKRGVLEIVEVLADIRPYWGYATNNKSFLKECDMLSKEAKSIYMKAFVDRSIKDALQFAAVTGAGGIYPYFSNSMYGSGPGEFKFMALGQPDILPIQLGRDKNYQEAYIVTLAIPMGIAEAHARFPEFQKFIKPFAKRRYGRIKGGADRKAYDANRYRMHNLQGVLEQWTDIFYTYVLDLRVNYGEIDEKGNPVLGDDGNPIGKPMEMGQPGTSWYYVVPFVGQQITRFEGGRSVTRAATEDDCRVYPNRRLLIHCDGALMYDGPGFDWHGMVPLVMFYMDEWAWESTGFPLFNGTANTQAAIDDLVRSVYRVAMARANPGKVYNMDVMAGEKGAKITSRQAEQMDPLAPGGAWSIDGDVKEPVFRPPFPEWCYNVPEWVMKTVEFLQGCILRQLGHDQIKSLEKIRSNITDPEKLLDAEGPTVMGTSRSMERGFRDLAEILKSLIVQWKTTSDIILDVGADGLAPSVLDYNPASVIPSHLQGENTTDASGNPVDSSADPMTRAKNFVKNLHTYITPHSMHYIAQAKQKLDLLALLGKGVPVDPETLANYFDLPNWGAIEGSTIMEKVFNWAHMQLEEKAKLAQEEKALGLSQPEDGGKPGPHPGAPGAGRPQTNAKPGKLRQKGAASGGRVVRTTAK